MLQLDQNAGLQLCEQCFEEYQKYMWVNNIYGYGKEKRQLQAYIQMINNQLKEVLGYDYIIFNNGATDSIKTLFCRIPDIKVNDGQHPTVYKYALSKELQNDCIELQCLTSSFNGEIQYKKKSCKYLVLDVSQAIGVIDIKQYKADCIFFSCHKLGGPFGTGFMCCKKDFYQSYIQKLSHIQKEDDQKDIQKDNDQKDNDQKEDDQKEDDQNMPVTAIDDVLLENGTFNVSGYLAAAQRILSLTIPSREQMFDTYQQIYDILSSFKQIEAIEPKLQKNKNLNDIKNTFGAINFEINKKYCPRAFQGFLEDFGVQIGFKTACQSNISGILRISWKTPQEEDDLQNKLKTSIEKTFKKMDDLIDKSENNNAIKGGTTEQSKTFQSIGSTFLQQINDNKFWLQGHFVPSHDKSPNIDSKYEIMFQKDLLKIDRTISLKIPPHNPEHRKELEIMKAKEKNEDFDAFEDGIRIQNRRVGKYLFINKPDAEIELTLDNFEKSTTKIFLSDQVFRSIDDNMLKKKNFPIDFQKEVNEYTVDIFNYPSYLPQNIVVTHPHPEIPTDKKTNKIQKAKVKTQYQKFLQTKSESSSSESDSESNNKEYDELTGGTKDPDYIRQQIKFMCTIYNLKLLTQVGGNALSVAILQNMQKLYRRGEKPSSREKQHQFYIIDKSLDEYENTFGTLLTSYNILKTMDPKYPNVEENITKLKFNDTKLKYQSNYQFQENCEEEAKSHKVVIQQLQSIKIDHILLFINDNPDKQIVIYLPYINKDEIEEDFGTFYPLHQMGYSYDVDYYDCYDVWDQQISNTKQFAKFFKFNEQTEYIDEKHYKGGNNENIEETEEFEESDIKTTMSIPSSNSDITTDNEKTTIKQNITKDITKDNEKTPIKQNITKDITKDNEKTPISQNITKDNEKTTIKQNITKDNEKTTISQKQLKAPISQKQLKTPISQNEIKKDITKDNEKTTIKQNKIKKDITKDNEKTTIKQNKIKKPDIKKDIPTDNEKTPIEKENE